MALSSTKPEHLLWDNDSLHKIAQSVFPDGLPQGLQSDARMIGEKLYEDLVEREVSITTNETSMRLLCTVAALKELNILCQKLIQETVDEARNSGVAWREIGEIFGTSPRRSMELYNPKIRTARQEANRRRNKEKQLANKEKN